MTLVIIVIVVIVKFLYVSYTYIMEIVITVSSEWKLL